MDSDTTSSHLPFDPIQYKINTKINWNTVASLYHKNWTSIFSGPFKSTTELVKSTNVNPNDTIFDIVYGTIEISNEIIRFTGKNKCVYMNSKGVLIVADISRSALLIDKSSMHYYFVNIICS